MTYRYEWRAMTYALFMHEDYPPFDLTLSSEDDGQEPHTSMRLAYPEQLEQPSSDFADAARSIRRSNPVRHAQLGSHVLGAGSMSLGVERSVEAEQCLS